MKIVSKAFFMLMLGLMVTKTYAQGEAAVPFLLLAPDSRASGVGESGTGLADNSSAIFWNPAGVAFLTGSEVSFTHSNWLPQFNLDLFYDYATYRQYIDAINGSLLASFTYMNYGEFIRTSSASPDPIGVFRSYDAALTLGYATKLHSDWGVGFNFRVIHSRLADKPTEQEKGTGVATSVSFDLGFMWRPESFLDNRFSVGMNLSNLGPKMYYIDQSQADPIPTNFRLGFAYKILDDEYNSLISTLDFSKLLVDRVNQGADKAEFYEALLTSWTDQPMSEELRDIVSSVGLEYWYGPPQEFQFALRSGFFYEDPDYGNRKFLTLGAGIRYDIYGFDFSYITTSVFKDGENHPLADTLRFTLMIGWGSVSSNTRGLPKGI